MPANLATELGFEVVGLNDLEKLVDQLINEHSDEWERFCSGDTKCRDFCWPGNEINIWPSRWENHKPNSKRASNERISTATADVSTIDL